MKFANPVANPAVMFRRQQVLDAGAFQFRDGVAQDYEMYCRLASKGLRFATHPECLLRYRIHPAGSKTAKLREQLRNTLAIKRMYFADTMPVSGRLRMLAERLFMFLPGWLVLRLFMAMSYQKRRRDVRVGGHSDGGV